MIFDTISQAAKYNALNAGFAKAFEFLTQPQLKQLEPGDYVIDGDKVYAAIVKTNGRKPEEAKIETHQRYIDIQMVLGGVDTMGYAPAENCSDEATPYDAEKDLQFFNEPSESWLVVKEDYFAIFYPEDAHMPLIGDGEIHKVVVKVAVDQGE